MKLNKVIKNLSYLVLITVTLLGNLTYAAEGVTPLQPGATTGTHVGALPPTGVYFSYDVDYEWGKLRNGKGKQAGIDLKASNFAMVTALTWVTDYKILGARYALGIAQPYKFARTTIEGEKTSANGLMSTSLIPAILSWDLSNGFHLGSGIAIVFRNGHHSYVQNADGSYSTNSKNLANRYYTFQPNVALSYFKGDWAFTMNNILDINFENSKTDYKSGKTYYLDLTATKRIDAWTVGAIGNLTLQLSDDKVNGKVISASYGPTGRQISSEGRKVEHIMFGPIIGYDFGSFSVNSRFLASFYSKNDPLMRFFHVGIAIPL